jgi:hypothetical protein
VANVSGATPAGVGPVVVTVNSISSPSGVTFTMVKPVINSLTPPAAEPGGTITLNGVGFGSSQGNSTVQFNSVVASVSSWSDTSITVTVPANATSGPVTVTEDGITTSGVQFTVLEQLSIISISPDAGPVGTTITINGTGFGPTQSNSTANLYGATGTNIVSWSDTQIVAVVSSGAATGPIYVEVAGITAFGPTFTIGTTVQLGSMSGTTVYASKWIGGIWLPLYSEGTGCSSCTLRGSIGYNYDIHGHVLTKTDEAGHVTS